MLIDTVRFPKDGTYRYMHPAGDMRILEQPTISNHHGSDNVKTMVFRHADELIPSKEIQRTAVVPPVTASSIQVLRQNAGLLTTINGITCKASKQNRLFLDARGYIAPCCWVSNNDIQRPGNMLKAITMAGKDLNNYNIRNRPIEKILHDDIFTKVFKALWKSDVLVTCRKKCGNNLINVNSKIEL